MKSRLVLVCAALLPLAAGCANDDCATDADCASGYCSNGLCVIGCFPECAPTDDCLSGSCVPAFTSLAIEGPASGALLSGKTFPVSARLELRAGSNAVAPPTLTLTANPASGPEESFSLTRVAGEPLYTGTVTVAQVGAYTLAAHCAEASLHSAAVPVTIASDPCASACGAWSDCLAGACVPAFTAITLTSPAPGAVGATLQAAAKLTRRIGSTRAAPPSVALHANGTKVADLLPTATSGDEYAGIWTPSSGTSYTLTAQSEAVATPSSPVAVTIDTTGPSIVFEIIPPPTRGPMESDPALPGAFRRDEEATVLVKSSDSDVDPATFMASVTGIGGMPLSLSASTCSSSQSFCRKVVIPLSVPAMKAFRGDFTLLAELRDAVGNVATNASKTIPVTRWKWAFDGKAGAIRTSPAIGAKGTVYFGTSNSPGTAFAVGPDHSQVWSFTTGGPIEASILVLDGAKERAVISGTSNGTGAVWAYDGTSATANPLCASGLRVSATPAYLETKVTGESGPTPTIAAVFNNNLGTKLFAIRLGAAIDCQSYVIGSESESSTGAVAKGTQVFFGDKNGKVQGFSLPATGAWTSLSGWPVTVASGNRPTHPLLLPSGNITGGGGGIGAGLFFAITPAGTLSSLAAPAPIHNATLLRGNVLIAGSDDNLLRFVKSDLTSVLTTRDLKAPAVGAPAVGHDETLYVSTKGSDFFALGSNGEASWSVNLGAPSESSPALDCARDANGAPIPGKPGVVYVGADDGKLYAFVTDSRGIDTLSPWPKFHRDPMNSGSADRPLASFACP